MKTYLGLIIAVLFLLACKNEPEQNVDVIQNVYNEGYTAVEKKFDSIFNKLSEIKDFNNFKVGTIALDSLSAEERLNRWKYIRTKEKPLTTKFTNNEALIVYDDLLAVFKSDKNVRNRLLNMGFLPAGDYSFLSTRSSQFCSLIERRAKGAWDFKGNDSITLKKKNKIINSLKQKVNSLYAAKYLILIDDIFLEKSKQKNDTEFYTGIIIMQVKVIDIVTKKILARKVFTIENTEFISIDAEAGESYINTVILMDLMSEKIKILNEFFGYKLWLKTLLKCIKARILNIRNLMRHENIHNDI